MPCLKGLPWESSQEILWSLLDSQMCSLHLNDQSCFALYGVIHPTQFKIPYHRHRLIVRNLKTIISWLWHVGVFLEMVSQTQIEESSSEVMAFLKCRMDQLMICFTGSAFPCGKCNLGPSELQVHAFPGHLWAGPRWSPHSLRKHMLYVRQSPVANKMSIYSAVSSQAESWTFHSQHLRGRQGNEPWG